MEKLIAVWRSYYMAIIVTALLSLLAFVPKLDRPPLSTFSSPEMQACHRVMADAGINMFDIQARCEKIRRGEWPAGLPITAK